MSESDVPTRRSSRISRERLVARVIEETYRHAADGHMGPGHPGSKTPAAKKKARARARRKAARE
jgi:hypothetical protein